MFEEILVNSDGASRAGMSVKDQSMSQEASSMITLRRETIECVVMFSIVWSIGATGGDLGRKKFNEFFPSYLQRFSDSDESRILMSESKRSEHEKALKLIKKQSEKNKNLFM